MRRLRGQALRATRAVRAARAGGDRGSVTIELVGLVTILVIVASLCVQGLYIAQVGSAAQQAARDGARAQALGRDPVLTARNGLPDWVTVEDIRTSTGGGSSTVEVAVRVPLGLPGITSRSFVVTRDAVLPGG